MKTRYRKIDTRTIDGLRQAERLQRNGWVAYSYGLYTIHFYKKENQNADNR